MDTPEYRDYRVNVLCDITASNPEEAAELWLAMLREWLSDPTGNILHDGISVEVDYRELTITHIMTPEEYEREFDGVLANVAERR